MKFALTLLAFPILGMALAIPATASAGTTDLTIPKICTMNPESSDCHAIKDLEKAGADAELWAKGDGEGKVIDGVASIAVLVKWVLEHPVLAAKVSWSRLLDFITLKVVENEWEKKEH